MCSPAGIRVPSVYSMYRLHVCVQMCMYLSDRDIYKGDFWVVLRCNIKYKGAFKIKDQGVAKQQGSAQL